MVIRVYRDFSRDNESLVSGSLAKHEMLTVRVVLGMIIALASARSDMAALLQAAKIVSGAREARRLLARPPWH